MLPQPPVRQIYRSGRHAANPVPRSASLIRPEAAPFSIPLTLRTANPLSPEPRKTTDDCLNGGGGGIMPAFASVILLLIFDENCREFAAFCRPLAC